MTHLFNIPTLPNGGVSPLRSLRFGHLHELGYKNSKLHKQSDCRSDACYTGCLHRGIQKFVKTFKYIVLISIYIYSSLNHVVTEALKNRVGKS